MRVSGRLGTIVLGTLAAWGAAAWADSPDELLTRFDDYPHAVLIETAREDVIDYEIGLGAIQKSRGAWRLKNSERISGSLVTYTWQIIDGFTSREVAQELEQAVAALAGAELLFDCEGRRCGPGVQWANRVFHQRILYGREELQRYRVFSLGEEGLDRVILYDSARTADRQYLHVEFLRGQGEDAAQPEP